ncbi:hypothetical protein [Saccharopolyspora sp. CA-218241]|uniref:hypothetical protein n=1 Tax=Saccharopolyspora sp. CA-218241 TaxID=3240027 RepID=UPI003D97F6D4
MSRRAILRWSDEGEWGHLAVVEEGRSRFCGFVRLSEPRLQVLLDRSPASLDDTEVWELSIPLIAGQPTAA